MSNLIIPLILTNICSIFICIDCIFLRNRIRRLEEILECFTYDKPKSAGDILRELIREQKEDALRDRGEK